jgi:hypothetical protein
MSLNFRKYIVGSTMALSLFLVGGCAGPKQSDLKTTSRNVSLVFEEPIVWRQSDNWTGERESTLAAGMYVAVGEDDEGTYYKGAAGCYSEKVITTNWNSAGDKPGDVAKLDCGIYVPFNSSQKIYLFSVQGTLSFFPAKSTTAVLLADREKKNATLDNVVAYSANSSASPLQAGVGAALGSAIAHGMLESIKGSFQKNKIVKPPSALLEKVQHQLSR